MTQWRIKKLNEICLVGTGKHDANHATQNGKYKFYTCAKEPFYCDTMKFSGECLILPGNGVNVGEVFYYNGDFDAIHQDLAEKGFPMIEIFSDRIEISNPGIPLVNPERFIDGYLSRNDKLADLMRRMGFCEEKGSGLDKVIFYNEFYQLPPIDVIVTENRTRVSIFSYKTLNELDKKEKVRACYQHACLKYVSNEKMTNQSLRDRFKIEDKNSAIASRIIRDSLEEKLIKEDDPESKSRKYASYLGDYPLIHKKTRCHPELVEG
jgi:hypothetical protein